MFHPTSQDILRFLLWATLSLGGLLAFLVVFSTFLQWRRDRANARRIALHATWERDLPVYLFQTPRKLGVFAHVAPEDHPLLRTFLSRFRAAVGGEEALALRELYLTLRLDADLGSRLAEGSPKERALAANEVWAFSLVDRLPALLPLLASPHPFVALAAARTLARSRDLAYADAVVDWVEQQDSYQQDRLLALLKTFGPQLVPWLKDRLDAFGGQAQDARLFALMASVHRSEDFLETLQALSARSEEDVVVAALKALAAIGHPASFPMVSARGKDPSVSIRIHATRALAAVGGSMATAHLTEALGDPAFDVRRTAAQGLASLGSVGASALQWVATDPAADGFARDMAQAQLEWLSQGGRA